MNQFEYDLQHSPESPINSERLPHDYRYRLNIDDRSEVLIEDSNNNLYWDSDDLKRLFDEFLLSDDVPENMKIERYCLNSDESATEVILEFDKKAYFRSTLRYFQLGNSPLTNSENETIEMLEIKNEIITLDYTTDFQKVTGVITDEMRFEIYDKIKN